MKYYILLSMLALLAVAFATPTGWTNDIAIGEGNFASIDLDSSGDVHMAWRDSGNLMYAKIKGNASRDILVPAIQVFDNCYDDEMHIDIDVDSDGNPHIVWANETSRYNSFYVKLDGSDGTNLTDITKIDPPAGHWYIYTCAIDTDASKDAHIFCHVSDGAATWEGSYIKINDTDTSEVFKTKPTVALTNNNAYVDMEIDSDGNAHVTSRTAAGPYYYGKFNGTDGSMIREVNIEAANLPLTSNIRVGQDDHAVVMFHNGGAWHPRFVKINGSDGTNIVAPKAIVDGFVFFGARRPLDLNSTGWSYIVFEASNHAYLMQLDPTGNNVTDAIDIGVAGSPQYGSLALHTDDEVHLAYYNSNTGNMTYRRTDTVDPTNENITPAPQYYNATITWETTEPCNFTFYYWSSPVQNETNSSYGTSHSVTFINL
ncbi:MAG: hypothetical protein JRL30_29780, partial [Deltaproteobacteria bacterium]|nr:hypothetical protein [Deltaproteobacteria bacterium]